MANAIEMIGACMIRQDPLIPPPQDLNQTIFEGIRESAEYTPVEDTPPDTAFHPIDYQNPYIP